MLIIRDMLPPLLKIAMAQRLTPRIDCYETESLRLLLISLIPRSLGVPGFVVNVENVGMSDSEVAEIVIVVVTACPSKEAPGPIRVERLLRPKRILSSRWYISRTVSVASGWRTRCSCVRVRLASLDVGRNGCPLDGAPAARTGSVYSV